MTTKKTADKTKTTKKSKTTGGAKPRKVLEINVGTSKTRRLTEDELETTAGGLMEYGSSTDHCCGGT